MASTSTSRWSQHLHNCFTPPSASHGSAGISPFRPLLKLAGFVRIARTPCRTTTGYTCTPKYMQNENTCRYINQLRLKPTPVQVHPSTTGAEDAFLFPASPSSFFFCCLFFVAFLALFLTRDILIGLPVLPEEERDRGGWGCEERRACK